MMLKRLWMCFFATAQAFAANVTLLQDEKGIVCRGKRNSGIKEVRIDAKDTQIVVNERGARKVAETVYQTVSFLDTGVLAKDDSRYALFHIQENGGYVLVTGKLYEMKEADCADTGASKTCTNEAVNKLFWSSEKLELSADDTFVNTKVSRYGHFSRKATYFLGLGSTVLGRVQTAVVLLDHGAKFQVLSGVISELDCGYQKSPTVP